MGASKGNKNATGNKGGGRKSAYQEQMDADFLWKLFTEPIDKTEIVKRIKKGDGAILDSFLIKGLAGNEKVMIAMFKKLFPDNINLTGNLQQKSMKVLEGNVRKILEAIPKTATRKAEKKKKK